MLVCIAGALLLQACAVTRTPSAPAIAADHEDLILVVLPSTAQEELLVDVDSSDAATVIGVFGGYPGIVAGGVVDAMLTNRRAVDAERVAEVLRARVVDYDIRANMQGVIAALQADDTFGQFVWRDFKDVNEVVASSREELRGDAADVVIELELAYRINQSLDQFVATVVHTERRRHTSNDSVRGSMSERLKRRYTFLSPIHLVPPCESVGTDCDGSGDGTQAAGGELSEQALADARREIESRYEDLLARCSYRCEAHAAARERELARLAAGELPADLYPATDVWTEARLVGYLDRAQRHLAELIALDWRDTGRETARADLESYRVTPGRGKRKRLSAATIGTFDGHRLVRAKDGDLYSLPLTATDADP